MQSIAAICIVVVSALPAFAQKQSAIPDGIKAYVAECVGNGHEQSC